MATTSFHHVDAETAQRYARFTYKNRGAPTGGEFCFRSGAKGHIWLVSIERAVLLRQLRFGA